MSKLTITEINKDTFWTLIDQGREQCGQDVYALARWLESRLMEMGPEQALNYDYIAHAYRAVLMTGLPISGAGSSLRAGRCTWPP